MFVCLRAKAKFSFCCIFRHIDLKEASISSSFWARPFRQYSNHSFKTSCQRQATESETFICVFFPLFFISTISLKLAGQWSAFFCPVKACRLSRRTWHGRQLEPVGMWRGRETAGESAVMCRGTREALGRNLNRRRLLCRQEMRGRQVPGMGLNWMFQAQTSIRKRRLMCRC